MPEVGRSGIPQEQTEVGQEPTSNGENNSVGFEVGKNGEIESDRTKLRAKLTLAATLLRRIHKQRSELPATDQRDEENRRFLLHTLENDIQDLENKLDLLDSANQDLITESETFVEKLFKKYEDAIAEAEANPPEPRPNPEAPGEANEPENSELTEETGENGEDNEDSPEDGEDIVEYEQVPVTEEERHSAGHILGCLGTRAGPVADSIFSQRVNESLAKMTEEAPALKPAYVDAIINKARISWPDELKQLYADMTNREALAHYVGILTREPINQADFLVLNQMRQDFDQQVREAVVEQIVAERLAEVRQKLDKKKKELANRKPQSKLANFFKLLGVGVGGAVVGNALRDTFTQWGIPAAANLVGNYGAVTASRALGFGAGAAAGAIVGGVIGGVRGFLRGQTETYTYGHIDDKIRELRAELQKNNKDLTEGEEVELLVRLLGENRFIDKLQGKGELGFQSVKEVEIARNVIEKFYAKEAREELIIALAAVENDPDLETRSPQENLARALAGLYEARAGGSEEHKTENVKAFLKGRQHEVWGKAGKSALWGSLSGLGIGGVFGALFPSTETIAQVNTEHAVHSQSFKDFAEAIAGGDLSAAREISGQDFHINLGAKYDNTSLYDLARMVMTDGQTGQANLSENHLRALHHLLSHPDEIAPHMTELKQLLERGDLSGSQFTLSVLNDGLGPETSEKISQSIYDHFKDTDHDIFAQKWYQHGPLRYFNERILPFGDSRHHLLGFFLASMAAYHFSKFGTTDIKRISEARAEDEGHKKPEEAKVYKPNTTEEVISPGIFESDENIDEATKNDRERERIAWTKRLPTLHGRFFFKHDKDGNIRAFRMWPLAIDGANPQKYQQTNANDRDAGTGATQQDPDAIRKGQFYVKEYKLNKLYSRNGEGAYQAIPHIEQADLVLGGRRDIVQMKEPKAAMFNHQKFADTWDLPSLWEPVTKNPKVVGWKDVFVERADTAKQVFVSPYEADKYAYAITHLGLEPGRKVDIDAWLRDHKLGDHQPIPDAPYSTDAHTEEAAETPLAPEAPGTPETPPAPEPPETLEESGGDETITGESEEETAPDEDGGAPIPSESAELPESEPEAAPVSETPSEAAPEATEVPGSVEKSSEATVETKEVQATRPALVENIDRRTAKAVLRKLVTERNQFNHETMTLGKLMTLINRYELQPTHKIVTEDQTFFTSGKIFEFADRPATLLFVGDPNKGDIRPALAIASNSQGVWRIYPRVELIGDGENAEVRWLSKGYDESSLTVPLLVQAALGTLPNTKIEIANNVDRFSLAVASTKSVDSTDKKDTDMRVIDGEITGVNEEAIEIPGIKPQAPNKEFVKPENIKFQEPESAPNFDGPPIASWQSDKVPMYGTVNYDIYPSRNGNFRYLFCRQELDGKTRAWVGAIEVADSETNQKGYKQEWVKANSLTVPLYEYSDQITVKVEGKNFFYGDIPPHEHGIKNGYMDTFEKYLGKIPVIQEYLAKVTKKS